MTVTRYSNSENEQKKQEINNLKSARNKMLLVLFLITTVQATFFLDFYQQSSTINPRLLLINAAYSGVFALVSLVIDLIVVAYENKTKKIWSTALMGIVVIEGMLFLLSALSSCLVWFGFNNTSAAIGIIGLIFIAKTIFSFTKVEYQKTKINWD